MKKIILLLLVMLMFGFKTNEIETSEIKYITAKSGLIFRDKPNGKRLGKFEFNEQISIIEHTSIFQEIKNGNKIIKGEWVGTNVNNKKVYIFDGFLSDTKTKITPELVKYFMGNNYWVLNDFKTILEDTKSYENAFSEEFYMLDLKFCVDFPFTQGNEDGLVGYFPSEQDHFDISIKDLLDNQSGFKLIQINHKKLTVRYQNYKNEIREDVFFNNYNESATDFFKKWFKGIYLLKDEKGTKKYHSDHFYSRFWTDGILSIGNKYYRIDNASKNTYFLSEIEIRENEDYAYPDEIPTGKKATLTKVIKQ